MFNPIRKEELIYNGVDKAHNLFVQDAATMWGKIELRYIGHPEKIIKYELEAVKPSMRFKRERDSIVKFDQLKVVSW